MSLYPLIPLWAWLLVAALVVAWAVLAWRGRRAEDTGSVTRRIAMAGTLLLIALHPGVGTATDARSQSSLDVVVVVDRTTSMTALDWDGRQERLAGVRSDLAAAARALPGSRFALLSFGRGVHLDMPFSSDRNAFLTAVSGIRAENAFDGTGSSPDRPLDAVRDLLSRDRDQHPDRRRILLYLGDGEVTESRAALRSFDPVRPLVGGGLVLGYGTTSGGRMRVFADGGDDQSFLTLPSGADALSRIDEGNLQAMASQAGITYLHSTRPGSVTRAMSAIPRTYAAAPGSGTARHDVTWLLGLVLAGLALVEARALLGDLRVARREHRAVSVP